MTPLLISTLFWCGLNYFLKQILLIIFVKFVNKFQNLWFYCCFFKPMASAGRYAIVYTKWCHFLNSTQNKTNVISTFILILIITGSAISICINDGKCNLKIIGSFLIPNLYTQKKNWLSVNFYFFCNKA